jgi:hypothetical protein
MYERAVTAAYISKHPDEAKRFWKYWPIPHRKVLNHAKELLGRDGVASVLGADHEKTVEEEYQKVIGEFQETLCKQCRKTRPMFSWSTLSLPAMAKKAGYGLEHCYYSAYAVPTQQAHSTVLAVTARLKQTPEGHFFDNSVQKQFGALAMMTAHVVILAILRVENDYFSLGLESEISAREAERESSWPSVGATNQESAPA